MRFRTLASASLATIMLGLAAVPASATTVTDGDWYVDVLNFPAAHAEGITGEGVTIAILDGQINPDIPTLASADIDVREPSFCYTDAGEPVPAATTELSPTVQADHGTGVASMVVGSGSGYPGQTGVQGIAPGAKVLYYATWSSAEADEIECRDAEGHISIDSEAKALNEAIDDGADIVSMSMSIGASPDFVVALARAFREGVVVVASLANSTELRLVGNMPARANGAIGVQAAGADGGIQQTGTEYNTNTETDVVAPGLSITLQGSTQTGVWQDQSVVNGTSLATPLVAGALALVKQKYPEATGNQLIQSLIHNTSGEPDHAPDYDPSLVYGYGLISVDNLLAVDPTTYPDENPLIRTTPDAGDSLTPTYDEIFNPAPASTEPDATETDTPAAAPSSGNEDDSDSHLGTVIAIAVGALVILLAIILIVVLLVRRSGRTRRESEAAGSAQRADFAASGPPE
jgi:subtilisin family serine protease